MALVIESGISIGGGISITPVSEITYTATIPKTTNVTGKVFYNPATNGF